MPVTFIRAEKISIKNKSKLTKACNHNLRKVEVVNADRNRSYLNEELVRCFENDYTLAIEKRLEDLGYDKKDNPVRKNAILGFDIITAFGLKRYEEINLDEDAWAKKNLEYIRSFFNRNKEAYGDNVISSVLHRDETSLHMHTLVIPIDSNGKLNGSSFLDKKMDYHALQDSYGEVMKENFGFERGTRGSVARHEDIRKYYADLEQTIDKSIPERVEGESLEEYTERLKDFIKKERANFHRDIREAKRNGGKDYLKLQRENKEYHEIERTYGDFGEIVEMLKKMDNLETAIQKHPDQEAIKSFNYQFEDLVRWGKKRNFRKKQKAAIKERQERSRYER